MMKNSQSLKFLNQVKNKKKQEITTTLSSSAS